MKCYLNNPDDESTCQNEVKTGSADYPFCSPVCHDGWAENNHPKKKSNFEAFLARGREVKQFQKIIDFGKK